LERALSYFLDRVDGVPPWDFDAPQGPRDASAGAIVAAALLDLGRRDEAQRLADAFPLNEGDGDGLLLHCSYRVPMGKGLDCATVWGDFFALETLERIGGGRSAPSVEL
jgi:unsaturated chondroitin disaccharide hydrolase